MTGDPLIKLLYAVMCGGNWFTIPELRARLVNHGRTMLLDTSISARIRDLRKPPWNRIVMRRLRAGSKHLEEYALMCSQQERTTAA